MINLSLLHLIGGSFSLEGSLTPIPMNVSYEKKKHELFYGAVMTRSIVWKGWKSETNILEGSCGGNKNQKCQDLSNLDPPQEGSGRTFKCILSARENWSNSQKRNVTNCAKEGGVWMDGWMGCWNKKGILELWFWKWFIKICLCVRILRNQSVFLDVLWIFCGAVVSVKYHQFWFTAIHFYFYHR